MKIAITGGTGFVGRHLARDLLAGGHQVVLISRGASAGRGGPPPFPAGLAGATCRPIGLDSVDALTAAFAGAHAVAHLAGITREVRPRQTFRRVHVEGTANCLRAAALAGIEKFVILSFLRARPGTGSPYHETKWQAEELVRGSGLDFTVVKAGVVYGRGDHMLDHLSIALRHLPLFAFVGFAERSLRPLAVADLIRVLCASLVESRLSRATVAALGPEELTLREAVRRVARVLRRRPLYVRLPVWWHRAFACLSEKLLARPLASRAQVRILSEGVVEPLPFAADLPPDLTPRTAFTYQAIRRGLPEVAPGRPGLLYRHAPRRPLIP